MVSNSYKQKIKQAFSLALPIVAGQLGQVLMGFFDTLQIGGLGHEYIAASGFANGIYWAIVLFGIGTLFSVSALVSKTFGEKKGYKSIGFLYAGLSVSVVMTVVIMIVIEVLANNLAVFQHDETDTVLGAKFLHIVNYSTPSIFLFVAAKHFLDGMGKTRAGMLITGSGLLLSIFLNWVLIYGELGFPRMEIEGAALSNTIARTLMAVTILGYIWYNIELRSLRHQFARSTEKTRHYIAPILLVGLPVGMQFFSEVAAFSAGQIMSGWISVEAEAAHLIAINLASVTFMVLTGFAAAGSIMVGYAYGEQNKQGIYDSFKIIFGITLLIELVFVLFFVVFRQFLPSLYTDNSEVLTMATSMLIFAALFQVSDGSQSVASGALRGVQNTRIPSLICIFVYWGVMIPLSYVLTFTAGWGLKGIWIGFLTGLTIAATLQTTWFIITVRKLKW